MNAPALFDAPAAIDGAPPLWLRSAVRDILAQSAGFAELDADRRRALAHAMVKVSTLAAQLLSDEDAAQRAIGEGVAAPRRRPVARAQDAPEFGAAADRVASTTRNILNAVSFPRFVTDLINGVFKAMLDSNAQQMHQYVDLLNNVSASLEGFADSQFSDNGARAWLIDKFPAQFEVPQPSSDDGPVDPSDAEAPKLRLRDGAQMPGEEALRAAFGMAPDEPISAGTPEQLVPIARRQIARQRQQMLSTMVMLGLQRIVIDSGSIHASMRFHIDTRDAASSDQGSKFDFQNRVKASGKFGVGPWGASAEAENTIGYVSTQRSQSTEEMNTDLDLNSSVDINFRSDYLPLNRMASEAAASRIRANSLNPETEAALVKATTERESSQRAAEVERQKATAGILAPPAAQPAKPDAQPSAPAARPPTQPQQPAAPAGNAPAPAGGGAPAPQPNATGGAPPAPQPRAGAPTGTQPPAGAPNANAPPPAARNALPTRSAPASPYTPTGYTPTATPAH